MDFEAHLAASRAKLSMDGTPLGNNVIHCYFLQVCIRPSVLFLSYLRVQRLERDFLLDLSIVEQECACDSICH